GEEVLKRLAELSGKLHVRIAVDTQEGKPQADLKLLNDSGGCFLFIHLLSDGAGRNNPKSKCVGLPLLSLKPRCVSGADVRTVNMRALTSGVLHTKFWVIDKKHIYIGSANMDWRSLTQMIFPVLLNHTSAFLLYCSQSSPPSFCADGRTQDLQSILSVMEDAEKFIYIAVMNYLPTTEFSHPKRYWADIDTQLRRSAYEKKVHVRLLISCWQHSPPVMLPFLKSLASVHDFRNKLDIQVVSCSSAALKNTAAFYCDASVLVTK
ncbi:hypothetical protein GOODEAATRI_012477, partial [Goodea atripinnis]